MEIVISNDVYLKDVCNDLRDYIKNTFKVANPDYYKLLHLGKWVKNTPKELCLYKQNCNDMRIPIGLLKNLKSKFSFEGCPVTVSLADDKINDLKNYKVDLYDYQDIAVNEMIRNGHGILIAPTGSGKTQMGIALACKLSYKTLWLTHTNDLLYQSYFRAKEYIPKDKLGMITAGKIEIAEGITFATIQTLAKQDLAELKYTFNTAIVDECHRLAGTPTRLNQFSKVINSLACRHKIGLTATLHRSDSLESTTTAYLGDVAHVIDKKSVSDKIISPKITRVNTGITMSICCLDTDGTINNNKLLKYLSENNVRNKTILNYLLLNKNSSNLILSNRIDMLNNIYELLPEELKPKAVVFSSKLGKKVRNTAIEGMKDGSLNFMFATYGLAKEGLDIPRLDRLYLISSSKDKAVVQQSAGRVMRSFPGKNTPVIYDFVDNYIKSGKDFALRKRYYIDIGGEI